MKSLVDILSEGRNCKVFDEWSNECIPFVAVLSDIGLRDITSNLRNVVKKLLTCSRAILWTLRRVVALVLKSINLP